jgi:MerR family transcriptional regulator, light-induced transcriptional regulator
VLAEVSVTPGLRLSDFATTPLYNIKAVVQSTGISPSTLRAWERRYNMGRPQRSDSGYRLYSERDVTVIRWLKAQVDAGMSISQAVSWLENIAADAGGMDSVVLPGPVGNSQFGDGMSAHSSRREQVRDFPSLQDDLLRALLAFNEEGAELVVAEAFAMYSVEHVGENLIMPVLSEIGERWHRGELSITTEHFATNYLIQRLAALLRSIPNGSNSPLIWVGCAPTELHEVGPLLLAIYLRRAGYRVHYLGQNVPSEDLSAELQFHQPAMLLFSASTATAAEELAKFTARLTDSGAQRPLIGYGGQVFVRRPELRSNIAGVFMGTSAQEAVEHINELLLDRSRQDKRWMEPRA